TRRKSRRRERPSSLVRSRIDQAEAAVRPRILEDEVERRSAVARVLGIELRVVRQRRLDPGGGRLKRRELLGRARTTGVHDAVCRRCAAAQARGRARRGAAPRGDRALVELQTEVVEREPRTGALGRGAGARAPVAWRQERKVARAEAA